MFLAMQITCLAVMYQSVKDAVCVRYRLNFPSVELLQLNDTFLSSSALLSLLRKP